VSDTSPQPNTTTEADVTAPGAATGHTGREVPVRLAPRPSITESAVGSPPPPVPRAEGETVTLTIDGREVTAPKGQLLIDAADGIGIYIPRFCYHPRMKPVGMCRMCLVEVEGPRGSTLMPACYNPVADGMKVSTTSEKTKKAQDGVLEFLLVNHPLDCPVCDKGGECPLQDQTLAYGPGESRFVEEKRHWDKPIPISELVNLDRERCIQCGRCVRFADEVAGDPLIDFAERGDKTEVAVFADSHPFTSYFSGNIVQICPVGALTATPYRFRARPWDLDQVESTCTSCSVGCRVAVQSSTDQLVRKIGVDCDPVNWAWLCDKGRFDYETVNSPERLEAPLVRKGDELVEVSWAEALDVAADGIRRALQGGGGQAVGVIGGSRLANEDAYAWAKLARAVLGTDHVDAQLGDGVPADLLAGVRRATIDEAVDAPLLLTFGTDPKEELPVLHLRLREAARERGLQIVELSPTRTGLSPYAALTLRHRPGELAQLVAALTADTQPDGEVAGVAAADIAQARAHLARARSEASAGRDGTPAQPAVVALLGRASLAESDAGVRAAVAALARTPGVAWLSGLRRANVHGALDLGLAPGVLPGRVGLDQGRAWFAEQWHAELPAARGLDTAGMLAAAARGRLGALVLLGADPETDFPDTLAAVKGLAGARFVVAVDTFLTRSARKADVVLPAAAYAERRGTFTNLEGRVSHLGAIVTAPGIAWPDWMIAAELAFRLGADLGFSTIEEIWDEITRVSPLHAGVDRQLLTGPHGRDGIVVPLPEGGLPLRAARPLDPMAEPGIASAELHTVPPRALAVTVPAPATGAASTDAAGEGTEGAAGAPVAPAPGDGSPEAPVAADPAGGEPAPAPRPPMLAGVPGAAPAAPSRPPTAGELRLVSRRTLWDGGTQVAHAAHLAPLARAATAALHPDELLTRGLTPGGTVTVSSGRGQLTLPVVADPAVAPGSVAVPFNLPGHPAASLIDAADSVVTVRVQAVPVADGGAS
jgi:NADH-quinone oxidoreductase subunit G